MIPPYPAQLRPHAIAHQGGGAEAVENTLAAFVRATDLGYRFLETDARLTADGIVVLFHDDTLDRLTDGSGRLEDLTWDQASTVRTIEGDHPLLRLDELFDALPEARLNIDAKTDAVVEPLVRLVVECDRREATCLASFCDRRLHRMRRLTDGRVATNLGRIAVGLLQVSSWLRGVLPLPVRGDVAQVPVRYGPFRFDTSRFVAEVRRRGLVLHYWTIDDAAEMHRLLDLGADGIMTDRPSVLAEVLEARRADG